MPRLEMRRKASDNEYLHKDFHIALNNALVYLDEKFGRSSVKEYLEVFCGSILHHIERTVEFGRIALSGKIF